VDNELKLELSGFKCYDSRNENTAFQRKNLTVVVVSWSGPVLAKDRCQSLIEQRILNSYFFYLNLKKMFVTYKDNKCEHTNHWVDLWISLLTFCLSLDGADLDHLLWDLCLDYMWGWIR